MGKRYTALRKVEILQMLSLGTVSRETLMKQHNISDEELQSWIDGYNSNKAQGLRQKDIIKRRSK